MQGKKAAACFDFLVNLLFLSIQDVETCSILFAYLNLYQHLDHVLSKSDGRKTANCSFPGIIDISDTMPR